LADDVDQRLAARIRSQCLSKGVSAHGIDDLIASTAINRNDWLLTEATHLNTAASQYILSFL
jgi:predicted nucleic acid-binding protein